MSEKGDNVKPGYTTTEFWLTLLAQVLAFLQLLGVLGQADADELSGVIAPAITSVLPLVLYIWSRTRVKANR